MSRRIVGTVLAALATSIALSVTLAVTSPSEGVTGVAIVTTLFVLVGFAVWSVFADNADSQHGRRS